MNKGLVNNFYYFFTSLHGHSFGQVLVELLFIGLVVFWVIRFLQGTRGARMLKGISFILIGLYLLVNLVSQLFDLREITFLHHKVLFFATFAIVVVFQPELRRALMRLGETRLFRSWSS